MATASSTTYGRWGTPPHPVTLSAPAADFLGSTLGTPRPRPSLPQADVSVPASRLSADQLDSLRGIVGTLGVSVADGDRLGHSAGCSLTDYLTLRAADPAAIPDAVVRPIDHAMVLTLLEHCAATGLAVVPFGGGTSVVGGVTAPTPGPRIAVAFDRMTDIVTIDDDSLVVTVQPGITGPVLERILQARGLTWGHLPQSWERASIGGYVATRSAGQASTGYGRSDETVEALRVATPTGEFRLGRAPHSAAGPDLRQLFIGSEGAFGIITEISLRVRRLPSVTRYEGIMFPTYAAGVAAFRDLAQARVTSDVMRLSDAPETNATLHMSGPQGMAGDLFDKYLSMRKVAGGCLAILGWEGYSKSFVSARRSAAWSILKAHGAVSLGRSVGDSWRKHRYDGPYLRDTLLDNGYIVETLETATHWADIHHLREAVSDALVGALRTPDGDPYVMSHISHVYETGGSLYFTVITPAADDPVAQWHGAKVAAMEAIASRGATITHHHAVGRDHAPWLAAEIGEDGVQLLRGIKGLLDPAGILNPGVLLGD
ncbi:MAG: FAD-binding oxidoreductase [Candidatus Nanopelagicales bacterium]